MTENPLLQLIQPHQSELKVKSSRFLADFIPIHSENDAAMGLKRVAKREYTANHHCYAWRIGTGDEEIWRVSDDGEPAGTAGQPIYQVLKGTGLTNTLVVVSRYFGGTKLGKGGLIRAYGGVVQEALPLLRTRPFVPKQLLRCVTDFELSNLVFRLIDNFEAELVDQDYGDQVTITLKIDKARADQFAWDIHEASNGIIKPEYLESEKEQA